MTTALFVLIVLLPGAITYSAMSLDDAIHDARKDLR